LSTSAPQHNPLARERFISTNSASSFESLRAS
jgi:hypothetical protein